MEVEIYKMTYKIKNDENILRILGQDFVKNNRNKGKIIINNKKFILKDIILVNNIKQKKMKMLLNKNIYNKSFMFKECESLESFFILSNFDDLENLKNIENKYENEYNEYETEIEEDKYLDSKTDNDSLTI